MTNEQREGRAGSWKAPRGGERGEATGRRGKREQCPNGNDPPLSLGGWGRNKIQPKGELKEAGRTNLRGADELAEQRGERKRERIATARSKYG